MIKVICLNLFLLFGGFASELTIISYNVQNLFDNSHDEQKNDFQFSIKGRDQKEKKTNNWTDEKIENKLDQISKVIKAINRRDLVILQEVENEKILEKLAWKLDFKKHWISNSSDARGIDIGIMYNQNTTFEVVNILQIATPQKIKTRSLVKIDLNFFKSKKRLTIFAIHWPSQLSTSNDRELLRDQLLVEIKKIANSNDIIIAGDFNIIDDSFLSPFKNNFVDLHEHEERKISDPPGTYFYSPNAAWSKFDRFLVDKKIFRENQIVYKKGSFQIFAAPWMTEKSYIHQGYLAGSTITGVPKRYDFKTNRVGKAGFSDHFPVVMSLIIDN